MGFWEAALNAAMFFAFLFILTTILVLGWWISRHLTPPQPWSKCWDCKHYYDDHGRNSKACLMLTEQGSHIACPCKKYQ